MPKWKYVIARGKDFYGVTSPAVFKRLVTEGRIVKSDMVYDFAFHQWIEAIHVTGMYVSFQGQKQVTENTKKEPLPLPRVAKSLKERLKSKGRDVVLNKKGSTANSNPNISAYFDKNSENISYNNLPPKPGLLNKNGLAAQDYERIKSIRFIRDNTSLFAPGSPAFWGVVLLGGLGIVGVLYKILV